MLRGILTEQQERLLAEERRLLAELATVLDRLDAESDRERLEEAGEALETLFLVAVVGTGDAPVETLADSLAGDSERTEGAVPGERRLPGLRLVLAAAIGEAPERGFAPADLALVMTRARHPLAGRERDLLVAAAGASRTIVVVDEVDMLRLSEDVDRMEEAVEVAARRILGRPVAAFGISTPRITEAPPPPDSLVPALARQVEAALRAPEILGPKLRRPARTAVEIARARRIAVDDELLRLAPDLENLEVIEGRLGRFEEAAETALRAAIDEADRAVSDYAERARRFVRRWTRPFRIAGRRRLAERFEGDPAGTVRERLEVIADDLEGKILGAAEDAREAVLDRLEKHPTPRLEELPVSEEAGPSAEIGESGALIPLTAPTGDRLLDPLHRASVLALALLSAGVLFAAVPFVLAAGSGERMGFGLLPLALGGGLGGAAVLAALGMLKLRRRTLLEGLFARVEEHRTVTADALTALAESRAERGREAIRAAVAPYAEAIDGDRERLERARNDLASLVSELERLIDRLPVG